MILDITINKFLLLRFNDSAIIWFSKMISGRVSSLQPLSKTWKPDSIRKPDKIPISYRTFELGRAIGFFGPFESEIQPANFRIYYKKHPNNY